MQNRDIFRAAIGLCGELLSAGHFEDYEERASSLLPLVIYHFGSKDRAWRKANQLEEQNEIPSALVSMDSPFPLSQVFATPAAAMLASLLVIGENPDMSRQLDELALRTAKTISLETPMFCEKIVEKHSLQ